jgi:pimeloyl-ACP methyl ester carboxylesterase
MRLNSLELNLVLHLDGDSTCTLDSPDQGAKGIAGVVKELTTEKVDVQFPLLLASYTAELKDGQLVGTFKQRGFSLPLSMQPGDLVRQRPQTPQPPFPYETREVTIPVPPPSSAVSPVCCDPSSPVCCDTIATSPTHTLAATLTLPTTPLPTGEGQGGAPLCLLLVSGSGLQDRDETLYDHKPFAVIADYLARHGIATLRYDDRGFGQSTGDASRCTTADFADDAAACIQYLRSTPLLRGGDGGRLNVGILGHSEGGSIAFMLAARKLADFIVTLAAPGIKGDTLLVEQTNALLRLNGQTPSMTLRNMRFIMATQETNPWYQYFVEYDPAADIAATRCPVLALNGSLDSQVLPQSNLTAIRQLLNLSEYPDTLPFMEGMGVGFYKEYPGLNHLFQHAQTGATTEYGTIEETISPEVLHDIVDWLQNLDK